MSTRPLWYFAHESNTLRHGDNRSIVIGETHVVDGPPALCSRGLHASRRATDALSYAPGPIVYRVRLGGAVVHGADKSCATERTYVAGGIDAGPVLRRWSRMCALDVIHLWDAPAVVTRYLKTGDESIRAAAWDAARDARAAARDAAWDAAWDAAREAARDAARDAAWERQDRRLSQMLSRAIRGASE